MTVDTQSQKPSLKQSQTLAPAMATIATNLDGSTIGFVTIKWKIKIVKEAANKYMSNASALVVMNQLESKSLE
jgi:hypothetical protein